MGTVIGLNKPETFATLAMLNGSINHMIRKNKESYDQGGETLYGNCLEKEQNLRKKYLKKLVN